jgi:hypothetical protein
MFYSPERKFLFIKCRKTGGTSFQKWLYDNKLETDIISGAPKDYDCQNFPDNFKKLGVGKFSGSHFGVRDFISFYGYEKFSSLYSFGFVRHPFDEYLSWLSMPSKLRGWKAGGNIKLLTINNKIAVSEIMRYEHYDECVDKIKNKFNLKGKPGKLNKHEHKIKELDRATKDMIIMQSALSFKLFGWSKD